MSILLEELMVSDIIERTGVEISYEDKKWLKERHCQWNCFALPFLIVCETKELAAEMADRLKKYDWASCKESLQISWEENGEGSDEA